jgi:hypothetical protein
MTAFYIISGIIIYITIVGLIIIFFMGASRGAK